MSADTYSRYIQQVHTAGTYSRYIHCAVLSPGATLHEVAVHLQLATSCPTCSLQSSKTCIYCHPFEMIVCVTPRKYGSAHMQCLIASGNKHALKLLLTKGETELPQACMQVCFSILLFSIFPNPLIPDDVISIMKQLAHKSG